MLRIYSGEYLVSPVPLHFSMNWCSHNCWYCFANLNKKERRTEMKDIARLLSFEGAASLEAAFLKKGYPVLVSNTTDPLARTNAEGFMNIWRAARKKGIRFCYQTKGGERDKENELVDDTPTMFYVSLTSDNEDLLREMEPGAPSFKARLDLIRRARRKGHHVVAGINPLVPGWWQDLRGALSRLEGAGVTHIWYGNLHLSHLQTAQMSAALKKRFATDLEWAKAKIKANPLTAALRNSGFNCFDGDLSTKRDFWRPYFDLGYPFMPTLDAFFTHLETTGKRVAFSFDYFDRWADIGLGKEVSTFKDYLTGFGRSIRNEKLTPRARNFREVHEWYWRILDFPTPLRLNEISIATDGQGEGAEVYTHNDRDILVFDPECKDVFAPLSSCGAELL